MCLSLSICLFIIFPQSLKTIELIELKFLRNILLGVHIGKESERGGKEMPFFKMLDSRNKNVGIHLSLNFGMHVLDNYSTFLICIYRYYFW